MAVQDIEKLKRPGTEQTWEETFRGIDKTSEKFDELVAEFVEFIGEWKDFSEIRRDRLADYIADLEKVQDHWEDINRWVEENTDTSADYAGSLSNIRDLFQEIASISGGIRKQTTDRLTVVRNLARIANENIVAFKQEEGLTESGVKSLLKRAKIRKEEFDVQLKLIAGKADLDSVNWESVEAREHAALREAQIGIRVLENQRRLTAGERARLRILRDEERVHQINLEYVSEYNRKATEGLVERLKFEQESLRKQRKGEGKNGVRVSRVDLAAKALKKTGLSEEAKDLLRNYSEFNSRRVEADLKVFEAEKKLKEQQSVVAKAQNSRKDIEKKRSYVDTNVRVFYGSVAEANQKLQDYKSKVGYDKVGGYFQKGTGKAITDEEYHSKIKALEYAVAQAEKKLQGAKKEQKSVAAEVTAAIANEVAERNNLGTVQAQQVKAEKEREVVYNTEFKLVQQVVGKFKEGYLHLGKWGGKLGAAIALVTFLWKNLVAVTSEADKLKQHIGTWSISAAAANNGFASSVQWLQAGVELAERFKINPVQLFSPNEIGNMAEVKNLLGLSSEQAANLTVRTKMAGTNADQYRVALTKGANAGNAAFKTAIGLGTATREALNASDAIALSMGNNAEKIGKAAVAASSLGMSLKDVENISQNLINFESSIQAEMQAQLLTGKQLNLAKAREYALNNDLAGVAQELTNQGISAADWGRMNVIQQENLAKALGMTRDQMAKMLVTQYLSGQLSKQALMDATHMTAEQIEALGVQERMKIAVQKLAQAFVPILEFLVPIVELVSNMVTSIAELIGKLTGLSFKANQPGVRKKDKFYTDVSSHIGSSRWKGKLTPERATKKLQKELKQKDLSREQKEQIQGQLAAVEELQKSGANRIQQEEKLAEILGVQTASMGSLGKETSKFKTVLTASVGSILLMPRAINGAATGMGKAIQGAVKWKDSFVGIFKKGNFKDKFLTAKNGPKAAAGSAATGAAGKTAQTVKGKGSNLPKLGRGIAGFLKAFTPIKPADIGKATLAALAFIPIAAMTPFIALASVTGPLAAKGLPALGRGIAGFFKAFKNGASIVQGAAMLSATMIAATPAIIIFTGAAIGLAVALRLLAPAIEAFSTVVVALGTAIKSAFEGVASIITATFGGITNLLSVITLEKAAALVALGGSFVALAGGLVTATAAIVAFPVRRFGRILNMVPEKPTTGIGVQEKTEEKQGIQQGNIEASVQEITIKQAQVQASAQKFTLEQKAADLSKVEGKLDMVIKAIEASRPDWDWLKFGVAMRQATPFMG